jgi:outer membrane protein OmpA-like peptidoglycan-associated protein
MSSTDPSHDRVEELLARAERVVRQPVPPRWATARSRWPIIAAGAVAVVVVIAALASAGGGGAPGQTTAVPLASTTSAVSTTIPIVITLPPNSATATTSTSEAVATSTTPPDTPRTTAFGVPARTITWVNGTLVLQGEVADQATGDAIRAALADSFGAAAVVDQLQIISDAPFTDADPLHAGTAVRFPAGQPNTDLASLRFLDQVADLLGRHPGVTADIHVTAEGDGEAIASQRASVIREYLAGRGVSADRLTSTSEAADGSTAQLVVIFHHLAG